MWKTIMLFFLFPVSLMATEENTHLKELKELFPYALLTEDFGILNKDDLRLNQCIAEPSLFSEIFNTSYPYWQCFELKHVKMVCEGKKYSNEEKSQMTMLVISGSGHDEINEFISRKPIKLKMCHLYLRDWMKFTKNEKHICISGDFINSEINNTGKKNRVWFFDRYKTKKGCDAYFRGTCDPSEKNRESCVVD